MQHNKSLPALTNWYFPCNFPYNARPYLLFQMLPIVKQQTKQLFNPTYGPLAELLTVKEVKELSLSVYESFSNVAPPAEER